MSILCTKKDIDFILDKYKESIKKFYDDEGKDREIYAGQVLAYELVLQVMGFTIQDLRAYLKNEVIKCSKRL